MKKITIDIKASSTLKLRDIGLIAYANSTETTPLCIAIKPQNQETRIWLPPNLRRKEFPSLSDQELQRCLSEAELIEAFDAEKTFYFWQYLLNRKYSWMPKPQLMKFRCISTNAARLSLPRNLSELAEMSGIITKAEKSNSCRLIFTPPAHCSTFKALQDAITRCRQDVDTAEQISSRLPPMSEAEVTMWRETMRVNLRGIPFDLRFLTYSQQRMHEQRLEINEEFRAITGLPGIADSKNFLAYLSRHNLHFLKLNPQSIETAIKQLPTGTLKRTLELYQSYTSHNPMDYHQCINLCLPDGRCRGVFQHYGEISGQPHLRVSKSLATGLMKPQRKNIFRVCQYPNLSDALVAGFQYFGSIADVCQLEQMLLNRAKAAMRHPGQTIKGANGMIHVSGIRDYLRFTLPSNRMIYLYKPFFQNDDIFFLMVKKRLIQRVKLTGCLLARLILSAMARDIVSHALTNLNECCIDSIFFSDFEIIAEGIPYSEIDELFLEACRKHPDWAAGFPIETSCYNVCNPEMQER